MTDIPQGIVDLPQTVELVDMEDVGDIGVLGEGRVHLEESHLHQIIVEMVFIDDLIHELAMNLL